MLACAKKTHFCRPRCNELRPQACKPICGPASRRSCSPTPRPPKARLQDHLAVFVYWRCANPFQLVPRSPMYLSVHPLAARSRLRIIRTRNTIGPTYAHAHAHAHRAECLYSSCFPAICCSRRVLRHVVRHLPWCMARAAGRLVWCIRRRCGCTQASTRAGRSIVSPSSTKAVRSTLAAWLTFEGRA